MHIQSNAASPSAFSVTSKDVEALNTNDFVGMLRLEVGFGDDGNGSITTFQVRREVVDGAWL